MHARKHDIELQPPKSSSEDIEIIPELEFEFYNDGKSPMRPAKELTHLCHYFYQLYDTLSPLYPDIMATGDILQPSVTFSEDLEPLVPLSKTANVALLNPLSDSVPGSPLSLSEISSLAEPVNEQASNGTSSLATNGQPNFERLGLDSGSYNLSESPCDASLESSSDFRFSTSNSSSRATSEDAPDFSTKAFSFGFPRKPQSDLLSPTSIPAASSNSEHDTSLLLQFPRSGSSGAPGGLYIPKADPRTDSRLEAKVHQFGFPPKPILAPNEEFSIDMPDNEANDERPFTFHLPKIGGAPIPIPIPKSGRFSNFMREQRSPLLSEQFERLNVDSVNMDPQTPNDDQNTPAHLQLDSGGQIISRKRKRGSGSPPVVSCESTKPHVSEVNAVAEDHASKPKEHRELTAASSNGNETLFHHISSEKSYLHRQGNNFVFDDVLELPRNGLSPLFIPISSPSVASIPSTLCASSGISERFSRLSVQRDPLSVSGGVSNLPTRCQQNLRSMAVASAPNHSPSSMSNISQPNGRYEARKKELESIISNAKEQSRIHQEKLNYRIYCHKALREYDEAHKASFFSARLRCFYHLHMADLAEMRRLIVFQFSNDILTEVLTKLRIIESAAQEILSGPFTGKVGDSEIRQLVLYARQLSRLCSCRQGILSQTGASRSRKCLPRWSQQRRHRIAEFDQQAVLQKWFAEHSSCPYPTKSEKLELMRLSGLNYKSVTTWFSNARFRDRRNQGKSFLMCSKITDIGFPSNISLELLPLLATYETDTMDFDGQADGIPNATRQLHHSESTSDNEIVRSFSDLLFSEEQEILYNEFR